MRIGLGLIKAELKRMAANCDNILEQMIGTSFSSLNVEENQIKTRV